MEAHQGDTIYHDSTTRAWNRTLLYNTDLFNNVTITADTLKGIWYVEVTERWYLWPYVYVRLEDITLANWVRQPDWQRITYSVGFYRENMTGRQDKLRIIYGNGYKQGFMASYNRPFLLPKAKIDALFYFNYFQNDEVNYAAIDGEVQRLRLPAQPVRRMYEGSIRLSRRLSQTRWLYLTTGYRHSLVADTLLAYNPTYLTQSSLPEAYPTLAVGYLHDSRQMRAFALSGQKLVLEAQVAGLGLGTVNMGVLLASYRRFMPLGSSRWNVALGGDVVHHLSDRLPFYEKFLISPDFGTRGYESYFVTGTTHATLKTELKYAVLPWRIRQVRWLPAPFRQFPLGLYPYLYADAGYMADRSHNATDPTYANKMLATVGAGLYLPYIYDNLLRLEYGINVQGQAVFQFNFTHALR